MYGLPESFDAQILVGQRLDSITFANCTTIYNLEPEIGDGGQSDVTFSVTSMMALSLPGDDEPEFSTFPMTTSRLPSLVALLVDRVTVENRGDLVIRFKSGAVLTIFEDDDPYESYSINFRGERIIG